MGRGENTARQVIALERRASELKSERAQALAPGEAVFNKDAYRSWQAEVDGRDWQTLYNVPQQYDFEARIVTQEEALNKFLQEAIERGVINVPDEIRDRVGVRVNQEEDSPYRHTMELWIGRTGDDGSVFETDGKRMNLIYQYSHNRGGELFLKDVTEAINKELPTWRVREAEHELWRLSLSTSAEDLPPVKVG